MHKTFLRIINPHHNGFLFVKISVQSLAEKEFSENVYMKVRFPAFHVEKKQLTRSLNDGKSVKAPRIHFKSSDLAIPALILPIVLAVYIDVYSRTGLFFYMRCPFCAFHVEVFKKLLFNGSHDGIGPGRLHQRGSIWPEYANHYKGHLNGALY